MNVTRTSERLVYKVSSGSGESHRVDLECNIGPSGIPGGECDCEDWGFVCYPNWKENGGNIVRYSKEGRTCCKHVEAARQKFADDILKGIMDKHLHG